MYHILLIDINIYVFIIDKDRFCLNFLGAYIYGLLIFYYIQYTHGIGIRKYYNMPLDRREFLQYTAVLLLLLL